MRESLTGRTGDPKGVPANAMTVGFWDNPDWKLEDGMWVRDTDEGDCLHDILEETRPESHQNDAHHLLCTCSKCQTIF